MKFSETYLYKLHILTNTLDQVFDKVLRKHAGISLSQFTLLAAVSQHQAINQRQAARFLGRSPAAINRQVSLAERHGWLEVERLGQTLRLTACGNAAITEGLQALEQYVFEIFADHSRQTGLMEHIDLLLSHTKGVLDEQATTHKMHKERVNTKE